MFGFERTPSAGSFLVVPGLMASIAFGAQPWKAMLGQDRLRGKWHVQWGRRTACPMIEDESDKRRLLRLDASRVSPACDVLARALYRDPLFGHLVPDARRREQTLPRLLKPAVRYGLLYGEVYATSDALEGVAVWLRPETAFASTVRLLRSRTWAIPLTVGIKEFARLWAFLKHTWSMREAHAGSPQWFLQLLGVDPDRQRAGWGSRLLEPMLERLDERAIACSLDTENPANLSYYERFGFRIAETRRLPGTELDCWLMIRDPRRPAG